MTRSDTEDTSWAAFRADQVDGHGNARDVWEEPQTLPIWNFDPGSSSEPRGDSADRVIVEPTIYHSGAALPGPHDRITVRGKTYEVEGETREWRRGDSIIGAVTTLRRVDG